MVNKQWGGKRENSGRKSSGKVKKPYTFYIEPNKTLKFGGEKKFREVIYGIVESYGEEKHTPIVEYIKPVLITPKEGKHDTYFAPLNQSAPINQYSEYSKELWECRTFDELKIVMIQIKKDEYLSRQEKIALEAESKKVMSDKGIYTD